MRAKRRKWWLAAGTILIAAAAISVAIDSESGVAATVTILALLWIVVSLWVLAWRFWRWLTYRVGVRLFFSYLLLGVLPFVFFAAFSAVGLYILMGQYTSVRFGSEMRRVRWELADECETVLRVAERDGPEAAADRLRELAEDPPEPLSHVGWQARLGGESISLAGGEDLPEIDWVVGRQRNVMVRHGDDVYGLVAAASSTGDRVVALIPLGPANATAISGAWWFDVAFFPVDEDNGEEAEREEEGGDRIQVNAGSDGAFTFTLDGEGMSGDKIWQPWPASEMGFFSRPLVVWFRVIVDVADLESGDPVEGSNLLALLRTSPANVWNDFTLSRYELGAEIWGALFALGTFFLILYGMAFAVAGTMILSITRAVKRLSLGARQVEDGHLDHRVPVKRHDQLGDLARSFNHMTDGIQSMLSDVAEKERLARELELAREIQESLLPARYLELGPLSVHATFQPAAEVGGDYFDVFPMANDRLVLAVGDVAGHGLSTGLLMASLKSSVAALVNEGYSGTDLIDKVNHLLMGHGQGRTMVTLAVIEIDPVAGRLTLANAGHPPAFLLGAGGEIEELMVGALPLGSRLCRPVSLKRPFAAGSRLFLYSDGLVEAVSENGEPYGYERLAGVLQGASGLAGSVLIATILESLGDYTAGAPLADDLTLLVVERGA